MASSVSEAEENAPLLAKRSAGGAECYVLSPAGGENLLYKGKLDLYYSLSRARASQCPNARGAYMVSVSSGRAFELGCSKWSCFHCSRRKRGAVSLLLSEGIREQWSLGKPVKFLTVTDPSPGSGGLTFATMAEAWKRFSVALRKRDQLDAYAAVVETQERGALHLHILLTGENYLEARREWNEEAQRWDDSPLHRISLQSGFGISYVEEVEQEEGETPEKVAYYCAKDLCKYLTAKNCEALTQKAGARVRPFRVSQGKRTPFSSRFPTLAAAEKHLAERIKREINEENGVAEEAEDNGPWILAYTGKDGEVVIPRESDKEKISAAGASLATKERAKAARRWRTTEEKRRSKSGVKNAA